ncbi:uncharacterized protein LOC127091482 [Lathyrus oleraceus]|uniref:DUF7745 domain-containing protein n=1 Tax=Pisum sativum TaxID=3888 RepID=A0A9D4YNZ3_PEA|nr:uncharacterized protein LOC127091482 [Pisum sativum]KAI5441655.1 hypothetical protein KIW84_010929 [Pisum sativum]
MQKRTLSVKAKMPQVDGLRKLRDLLSSDLHSKFVRRYGKILYLLDINVQVDALTALLQFYDPPMRCFTFQDFQLAPTLEEFGEIFGYPLEKDKPYCYLGHYTSISKIIEILGVDQNTLERKRPKGHSGFRRSFFEERALVFALKKDWDAFMEVLALIIFGVIIFPRDEEIIDLPAIDVFLAFKNRGENPTHAVLADMYYSFNYCYEKKGKKIICCLPALYVWMINLMFNPGFRRSCPIDVFHDCDVKKKTRQEWGETLVNLNEYTVKWYQRGREINEVIFQCGNYPNVPLMGTKGCINYNPVLALRQLGIPIVKEPEPSLLTPLVVYDLDIENIETLRTIQNCWKNVIRKGNELRFTGNRRNTYQPWLKKRVEDIKLPFQNLLKTVEEIASQSSRVNEQ